MGFCAVPVEKMTNATSLPIDKFYEQISPSMPFMYRIARRETPGIIVLSTTDADRIVCYNF